MPIRAASLFCCGLLASSLALPAPSAGLPLRLSQRDAPADEPDRLFAQREAGAVRHALDLWKQRLAGHPADAESAWRAARAAYWLGVNDEGPRDRQRPLLDEAVALARRATAIAPHEPHGHFWLAAGMGALSELFGRREGLKYHDDIRKALRTVLAADPGYMRGAAQRALGRWYATVPAMFGGNRKEAEAYYRAALGYRPDSVISLTLYGELLVDLKRPAEARRQFEAALAAPAEDDWAPEDDRVRARARAQLAALARPATP